MSRMKGRRSTSEVGTAGGTGASYYRQTARPIPPTGRRGSAPSASEWPPVDVPLVPPVPVPDGRLTQPPAEEDRPALPSGGEDHEPGGGVPEQDPVPLQELHLPLHPGTGLEHRRCRRAAPIVSLGTPQLPQRVRIGRDPELDDQLGP